MTANYRQDSAMYQALVGAGVNEPEAWDDETPPWDDSDIRPTSSTQPQQSAQEAQTMTDNTAQFSFEEFFGQLSQYPRRNVLERLIMNLISEHASQEEFADRVMYGDDVAHQLGPITLDDAGFPVGPIDQFERPAPDTNGTEGRTLTENQYNLVLRLQQDAATALQMAAQLVPVFEALEGEKPSYSIRRTAEGRYDQIKDIHLAIKNEYIRSRARWLKRMSADSPEGFSKAGAQALIEELQAQRNALMGAF